MNERKLTYEILTEVIINNGYANLMMRKYQDSDINFNYVTEVVYGVLRNYSILKHQFKDLLKKRCEHKIEILIIIGIYELHFMKSDDYAVVNEIVKMANPTNRGFVNFILRESLRRGFIDSEELSIQYSIPTWIYRLWIAHYGEDIAKKLAKAATEKLPIYYRLNNIKASFSDLKDLKINKIDDYSFTSELNLIKSAEFRKGLFAIQDLSAAQIIYNLDLNENNKVLDMCAAPGTKTSQIAGLMNNKGSIVALDIHEHRVELIDRAMQKFDITNVETKVMDASIINEDWIDYYDRILLDAPCSGFGVLSRKPDIKFHIKPEGLDEIIQIQAQLLDNAYKYLKNDGILVYSTCTLNLKENEKQVKAFLNRYSDLELMKEETIFSYSKQTDGFYYAKIIKRGR